MSIDKAFKSKDHEFVAHFKTVVREGVLSSP